MYEAVCVCVCVVCGVCVYVRGMIVSVRDMCDCNSLNCKYEQVRVLLIDEEKQETFGKNVNIFLDPPSDTFRFCGSYFRKASLLEVVDAHAHHFLKHLKFFR